MNPASASYRADAPGARVDTPAAGSFFSASEQDWPIAILGVPIDHVTVDSALQRIAAMIATRTPHYVVTAGIDFLVQAQRDAELRRILLDADLVLGAGHRLLWASRWLGNALPQPIAAVDLAPALLRLAAENGYRVCLVGTSTQIAEEAQARLKREHASLQITAIAAATTVSAHEEEDGEILRHVRATNPDLLVVALASPEQEKWIATHYRSLGAPVTIGIGPTLELLAGHVKPVPEWMRRSGLATLGRLARHPQTCAVRMMQDLACFVPTVVGQWWRMVFGRVAPARPKELSFNVAEWCSVDAGARLTRRSLQRDVAFWQTLPARAEHCLVDLSKVRRIDGTGVAFLIRWRKELLARGRRLVLLAPSRILRRTLDAMRLADHFVIANDVMQAAQQAEAFTQNPPAQRDGTTRSLAWCGEIIAANCEDVWRMTTDHIAAFVANRATLVIVDLTRLRFVDSSGAALMFRLKKWAQALHVEILFAHPPPNVRNVLQLTHVDHLLLEGGQ